MALTDMEIARVEWARQTVDAPGTLPPFAITVVEPMAFQSATTFPALSTEAKASGAINQSCLLRIINSSPFFVMRSGYRFPGPTREKHASKPQQKRIFFSRYHGPLRPWNRKPLKRRNFFLPGPMAMGMHWKP